MKKILLFYASFGGGHLSAANSIKQCIDENFHDCETKLIDCMLYVNKPINAISTTAYKEMAKRFPWVWGDLYNHSSKGPLARISSTSNNLMAKKLLKLLKEYQPDIIISTHPFASQMVSYLKRKALIDCKLATILTDFAPHEQWLVGANYVDYFFVSHEKLRQELINTGISPDKVFATGIPLSYRFLLHYNKEIKNSFGLDPDKKVILFFGGGAFGLGRDVTIKILSAFIHNIGNYQIVAIAGKNEKMKEAFENIVIENHKEANVQIFEYTNKVPEFMSISSLVVTKPGGLTTSESLASGLPIVVINPIPGQEEENAEYLVNHNTAIWLKKDDNVEEIINNLLSDSSKLEEMSNNAKSISKPNSTNDICKILLNN